MTLHNHSKVQMPALPIRNKQSSMDMTNDAHARKAASVYQMAQNAASLNSTHVQSNFASMVGKENQHTQDHQVKMLSARMELPNQSLRPIEGAPRTQVVGSSKTQMLNRVGMTDGSQSKLSQNSVTRGLSTSDKG